MVNTAKQLFTETITLTSITVDAIEQAKLRFDDFRSEGVISSACTFDDAVWKTTDEYANVGLSFMFNRVSYKLYYEQLFGFGIGTFINAAKAFALSVMGQHALLSIQGVLRDIRYIINTPSEAVLASTFDKTIHNSLICADFFSVLPGAEDNDNIAKLCIALDNYADIAISTQSKVQRTLADFDSYFRFGDIISDYWKSPLTLGERLFFFPLYLWWMLTSVIPLRPREFLVTPRNCLTVRDGKYYLSLRRNRLKGRNGGITYKLDEDYVIDTYPIPESLAKEFQRYIDLTQNFDSTDIDTLFVSDPHYNHWGHKKHTNSRYLTYMNMRTILRCFYEEVIQDKYGYRINYAEKEHLPDGEISRIHLGDTRHIALINLTQSGGDPVVAMMLAGHLNEEMSSHYASNLTKLIECYTYRQFRRLNGNTNQYQLTAAATRLPATKDYTPLEDKGRCYSTAFKDGKITDCLTAVGPACEIGYCPSCPHYRAPGVSYFSDDDKYKASINRECSALKEAVETVRSGKGAVEDIGEVLMRIRTSSVSYQHYLMEKNGSKESYGKKTNY